MGDVSVFEWSHWIVLEFVLRLRWWLTWKTIACAITSWMEKERQTENLTEGFIDWLMINQWERKKEIGSLETWIPLYKGNKYITLIPVHDGSFGWFVYIVVIVYVVLHPYVTCTMCLGMEHACRNIAMRQVSYVLRQRMFS